MKFKIQTVFAEKSIPALIEGDCKNAAEFIKHMVVRHGNPESFEIDVKLLGVNGLEILYALAKTEKNRSMMMQISSYRKILENPFEGTIDSLRNMVVGLKAFIKKEAIDGWLYCKEPDGVIVPWFVRDIYFKDKDRERLPFVAVILSANTAEKKDGESKKTLTFLADDVFKKTIPEVLTKIGFYHETLELKNAYENDFALFGKFRPDFNAQFSVDGMALLDDDRYKKNVISIPAGTKAVNDEEMIKRSVSEFVDNSFWGGEDENELFNFNVQPFHCRLYMFNLSLHKHMWVHVSAVTPYKYRPELRDKLVLPDLHRDLIDILTDDMDVVMDDIVDGKSGGTTILCQGAPGLGKTLTSEIYSEVVKKPLYRVHSGQLGTTAESVEAALSTVFQRASRWGAVLLLDEADVFIRRRDNDIDHNAVVAVFLRTLEYFDGLMFMTTNRSSDIDDAILSRCIAIIKYEHPDRESAKKIWNILSAQFSIELSELMVNDLTAMFTKASGRDIKELLKLSSKYARRKEIPLDVEVFRKCAMFRGLLMQALANDFSPVAILEVTPIQLL